MPSGNMPFDPPARASDRCQSAGAVAPSISPRDAECSFFEKEMEIAIRHQDELEHTLRKHSEIDASETAADTACVGREIVVDMGDKGGRRRTPNPLLGVRKSIGNHPGIYRNSIGNQYRNSRGNLQEIYWKF